MKNIITILLFVFIFPQIYSQHRLEKYNKYITAYATDTVIFTSTQNVWYQLTNATHDAFEVVEQNGFHIKQDTLVSEIYGMIEVYGQFRVSGPAGQANRMYEYRLRYKRNGVTATFWWFQTSSSGEVVLRTISGTYRCKPGDKIWGEIRTLSATGQINFFGGSLRVTKID